MLLLGYCCGLGYRRIILRTCFRWIVLASRSILRAGYDPLISEKQKKEKQKRKI